MSEETLLDVERALQEFLPAKWEEGALNDFLGSSAFERDKEAIKASLTEPIRDLIFRGGKRLRPVLFLTLVEGFDLKRGQYLDLAVAIELIHNGTLAVDDVEDSSTLRRGKPALHTTYGVDVALNAGNAMYFLPLAAFVKQDSNLSDSQRLRIFEIYSQEMINVHFGQAIDIHWHKELPESVTQDQYLEMCRLKTGSLMRMSVRFACAVAGQDAENEQMFTRFAESTGIAFQIKDDVLDLTADPKTFGKQYGNDIQEGKLSLPVIFAIEELSSAEASRLRDILRMHTQEAERINEARSLILKTSAIKRATDYASELFEQAWKGMGKDVLNTEGYGKLQQLVEMLSKREW
ncbi:MAG: polyprenyl synthetase family protein [Candidatus Andersenbacteria bacterium]